MSTPTIYYTDSNLTLVNPRGIAIDYDRKRLLICEYGSNQLVLCTLEGLVQLDTLDSYDSNPIGPINACYHNEYFYVCDYTYHTLVRIRARDLSYKDHFGTYGVGGSTTSTLQQPAAVTTDGQYLYVVDSYNDRIVKLTLDTLTYVTETSNINGAFTQLKGICYKKAGGEALFISDDDRIIKCKTDFTYIEQNQSDLTNPTNIAFWRDYIHVCDSGDILVFSSDGLTLTETYTDDSLVVPDGIDIINDAMFISDVTNDNISVWRVYNPFDALTQSSSIKFGSEFFQNPTVIVGQDTLTVGTTQDYNLNHWKEENSNNYRFGFVPESDVSSSWTEESDVSSTWTEES